MSLPEGKRKTKSSYAGPSNINGNRKVMANTALSSLLSFRNLILFGNKINNYLLYLLTHSLTHSLSHSLNDSLTQSLSHLITYISLTYRCIITEYGVHIVEEV